MIIVFRKWVLFQVMLKDKRSAVFKTWNKTVNQEVKYMFQNMEFSDIAKDKLLGPIEFVGFEKGFGGRIELKFKIRLLRPHWDNKQRLENAFAKLAVAYRNQSADDLTVLGKR